jgi:hypothetical protein
MTKGGLGDETMRMERLNGSDLHLAFFQFGEWAIKASPKQSSSDCLSGTLWELLEWRKRSEDHNEIGCYHSIFGAEGRLVVLVVDEAPERAPSGHLTLLEIFLGYLFV